MELGALSNEAERAVIHDWLTKDGGAIGDPTAWIDAIARESFGWPHHILSYIDPAAVDQLKADSGNMVMNGLNAVLEVGREGCNAYCKERAYGFPEEERQSLANAFSNVSIGGSTTRRAIMSSLAKDFGLMKQRIYLIGLRTRAYWINAMGVTSSQSPPCKIGSCQITLVSKSYSRKNASRPRT